MQLHLYNKQNILILTGTYPVCHLQAPHWGRHYQEDSHGGPQEIVTDCRVWRRHEGGHLIAAGGGGSSSSSSSVRGFTPDPAPDGPDQAPPLVGQLWRGCDVTILVNHPYLSMGSTLLEMITICRNDCIISLSPMSDGNNHCHSAFLNVSSIFTKAKNCK